MNDKERILSAIITRTIPGLLYGFGEDKEYYVEPCMVQPGKLNKGDLVFANTSIYPNDFSVGFVHEVKKDCVVIRKIGTQKLCNYYNEGFTKINKDRLGYEILEGLQYKTYRKVLKAFEYTGYCTRFKSISFSGNKCTVQARTVFKNDLLFEVTFDFDKNTKVKEIGKILENADKGSD